MFAVTTGQVDGTRAASNQYTELNSTRIITHSSKSTVIAIIDWSSLAVHPLMHAQAVRRAVTKVSDEDLAQDLQDQAAGVSIG
jgi:hypothetical protein